MKKFALKYVFAGVLALGLSSCDFGDINNDPDSPSDAPQNALLPGVIYNLNYAHSGDAARFAGIFTQHYTGAANQSFLYTSYQMYPADMINLWQTYYEDALPNIDLIITKSEADGSKHYAGIGKVLKALMIGTCTDMFGDIPFSEANQGAANLTPKYDSQDAIYAGIQSLLDEAIADLSSSTSTLMPAGDDVIYGGDVSKWIMMANTLKARYYMHTTKIDATAAATNALAALAAGGFTSNADNALVPYDASQGNPASQFYSQRAGDVVMGEAFVEMMKAKFDPRLYLFVEPDADGNYTGSSNVTINAAASLLGSYFADPTTSMDFITYAEAKFIEAEALVILNGAGDPDAEAAYMEGIAASMERVGVDPADAATYMAGVAFSGDATNNWKQVIEEKYVALFNNPETFVDWRRTGFPTLSSATGTDADMARRFPYSLNELNYNPNTPSTGLTDRMWWDM